MTRKLFESYKAGNYKPYNRYCIETFKPVYIPAHKQSHDKDFGYVEANFSTLIPVNDGDNVTVTFNGDNITFSINAISYCLDRKNREICPEYLPPFTVTINYKNIKAFY